MEDITRVVAYNIFIFTASIRVQLCDIQRFPTVMAERDFYRYGGPRRGPSMHGARGGGQADPRRPSTMEGFPPDQQAAHRAPDGNRYFYDSVYNQNYGDNLDRYVDNSDLNNDNFMDYNNFHDNYNSNANDDYGLPPRLTARINNDYFNENSNMNSGYNVSNYYDSTNNNNYGDNLRNNNNLSDIDMRQNNYGNNNSVHGLNIDQRRFHDLDNNYQDDVSQPVTLNNLRDIIAGLIVPPQPDMPINNLVHGLNRNTVRPPPRAQCLLGIIAC